MVVLDFANYFLRFQHSSLRRVHCDANRAGRWYEASVVCFADELFAVHTFAGRNICLLGVGSSGRKARAERGGQASDLGCVRHGNVVYGYSIGGDVSIDLRSVNRYVVEKQCLCVSVCIGIASCIACRWGGVWVDASCLPSSQGQVRPRTLFRPPVLYVVLAFLGPSMGLPHCELLGNGISSQQELGSFGLVELGGRLRFRFPAKEIGVLC